MRDIRQISYKKSIMCLLIGVALFGISFWLYGRSNDGQSVLFGSLTLVSFLIGFAMLIYGLLTIIKTSIKNKELSRAPYKFDFSKELMTYKMVGREKGKLKNGAIKCKNYMEWEGYVKKEFSDLIGNENFYHFLIRQIRISKTWIEIISAILIPIEILVITVLSEWFEPIQTIIVTITMALAVEIEFVNGKSEIHYLKDLIVILFPNKVDDFANGII